MKTILITAILYTISFSACLGQTYSDTINDSTIVAFMNDVLNDKATYESAFNKKHKRVFSKAIQMRKAHFQLMENPDSLTFDLKFRYLLDEFPWSKDNLEFLQKQYVTMKDTTWQHKLQNVKFKKKFKVNYFQYSLPMFSQDYKSAILWRYTVCGSHCAYSELHWYKFENGNWTLYKFIEGWIS